MKRVGKDLGAGVRLRYGAHMRSTFWWSLGFLLFVLGFSSQAAGYCRTTTCELSESPSNPCLRSDDGCSTSGEPLFWSSSCLSYAVQLDGSEKAGLEADQVQALVQEAFQRWRGVTCPGGENPGFLPVFQGFVACDRQQVVCGGPEANVNTIVFQDELWPAIYPRSAAGLTSVVADLETGEINDAELELNGTRFSFDGSDPMAPDLANVLTHEIGHFLGLAHSGEEDSIMAVNYRERSTVELALDDVAAICNVFPPHEKTLSCDNLGPAYDACQLEDLSSGQNCRSANAAGPDDGGSTRNEGCSIHHGSKLPSGLLVILLVPLFFFRGWRQRGR